MDFGFIFKSILLSFFIFLIVFAIGNASTSKMFLNNNNHGVKNAVKESLNIGELRATGNVTFDEERLIESTIRNYSYNNPNQLNKIDLNIYINSDIVTIDIISKNYLFNSENFNNSKFSYKVDNNAN